MDGKIDHEVMLLAIYWHDVWKARFVPQNPLHYLYGTVHEGIGSMKIFRKYALQVGLDDVTREKVEYAIRKHSDWQLLGTTDYEAKLLFDLDELENWNFDRYSSYVDVLGGENWLSRVYAKAYYEHRYFYKLSTQWAQDKIDKMRPDFLNKLNQFNAQNPL